MINNYFLKITISACTAISLLMAFACKPDYSPKPRGYFRIDFPGKEYQEFDSTGFPYEFEYPVYGKIVPDESKKAAPYWINIEFPRYNGKIHITYKTVENNLKTMIEDSRTLAYKHTVKADAINEKLYVDKSNKVYGVVYNIKGNTASSVQFFLTDSTRHFLRGSLYFWTEPDKDSLAPVIRFFKKDITQLIETLEWKP